MNLVISDASPLINLARVGRFDLLAAFYGRIVIPQAVYDEVVVRGEGREGSREVRGADWIEVRTPQDGLAVRALAAELGTGEAEAIVLAQEFGASLLLVDEIRGRRIAQQLGLQVRGTLEILADPQVAGVGANCTILCGGTIGQYAFIGAGAVVLKDVPDYALVVGNPGRIVGWMCVCGNRIDFEGEDGRGACQACRRVYRKAGQRVSLQA